MASEAKRVKQDLNEILIEQLICYICKTGVKVGKHRWYRCPQLHMICQDCMKVKESYTTPTCDCKKKIHGYCKMTEAMLSSEKMRFKCENQSRGCQEMLDAENMIFHQSECIYRLVVCPNLRCRSKVPFHDLLNHMKTEEFRKQKITATIGKGFSTYWRIGSKDSTNSVFPSLEIEVDGIGTFIVVAKIQNDVFYHWIHFLGSPQEAKKFLYTFMYINKTTNASNVYTNRMVSIDETSDTIIENGNCFGIPGKLFFKHFVLENKVFKYILKIRNSKEEAKDDNVKSGVLDNDHGL